MGLARSRLTLARRSPAREVWAIDINDRARALTRGQRGRERCRNIRVVGPDEVPADVQLRTIWSNPPIRIGKAALHDLLVRWLTA